MRAREMIAHEVRESGAIRLDRTIDVVRSDGAGVKHDRFADTMSVRTTR